MPKPDKPTASQPHVSPVAPTPDAAPPVTIESPGPTSEPAPAPVPSPAPSV